jgi:hypothetical protein
MGVWGSRVYSFYCWACVPCIVHFIFVLCISFYYWAYIQSNWAFSICNGHSFLMLGVYTEYWAFSIRIGHFFYYWAYIQSNGAFSICNGHSFLMLGVYTEYWAFFYLYCCISFIIGRIYRALGHFLFVMGIPFPHTIAERLRERGGQQPCHRLLALPPWFKL